MKYIHTYVYSKKSVLTLAGFFLFLGNDLSLKCSSLTVMYYCLDVGITCLITGLVIVSLLDYELTIISMNLLEDFQFA